MTRVYADASHCLAAYCTLHRSLFHAPPVHHETKTAFDFRKLRYAQNYSLVIAGPMPHKTSGTGVHSSAIMSMMSEDGYPPVIECGTNGLSISKSSFKNALKEAMSRGMIDADR